MRSQNAKKPPLLNPGHRCTGYLRDRKTSVQTNELLNFIYNQMELRRWMCRQVEYNQDCHVWTNPQSSCTWVHNDATTLLQKYWNTDSSSVHRIGTIAMIQEATSMGCAFHRSLQFATYMSHFRLLFCQAFALSNEFDGAFQLTMFPLYMPIVNYHLAKHLNCAIWKRYLILAAHQIMRLLSPEAFSYWQMWSPVFKMWDCLLLTHGKHQLPETILNLLSLAHIGAHKRSVRKLAHANCLLQAKVRCVSKKQNAFEFSSTKRHKTMDKW